MYVCMYVSRTHNVLLLDLGQGDHGQGSNLGVDYIYQIGCVVQHQCLARFKL